MNKFQHITMSQLYIKAPVTSKLFVKCIMNCLTFPPLFSFVPLTNSVAQCRMDSAVFMLLAFQNENHSVQQSSRECLYFLGLIKSTVAGKNWVGFDVIFNYSHAAQHRRSKIDIDSAGLL